MRRVTLSGVPVHPALVHFRVAFWILMPLLDLGNRLGLPVHLMSKVPF